MERLVGVLSGALRDAVQDPLWGLVAVLLGLGALGSAALTAHRRRKASAAYDRLFFRAWMGTFVVLEGARSLMVIAGRLSDPDAQPYPPPLLVFTGAVVMCAGVSSVIPWLAVRTLAGEARRTFVDLALAGGCVLCAPFACLAILAWTGVHNEGRETPKLVADVVIPASEGGEFVLIRRDTGPFEGAWALPGGFVEVGETVEAAAVREVREETGLRVELVHRIGVYSDPGRDPRGHFVSVAYLAHPMGGKPLAGEDVAETGYIDPRTVEKLAFDHREILDAAAGEGADLRACYEPVTRMPVACRRKRQANATK